MVIFEQQLNTTYTVMEQSWLGASMMSAMSLASKFTECRPAVADKNLSMMVVDGIGNGLRIRNETRVL